MRKIRAISLNNYVSCTVGLMVALSCDPLWASLTLSSICLTVVEQLGFVVLRTLSDLCELFHFPVQSSLLSMTLHLENM